MCRIQEKVPAAFAVIAVRSPLRLGPQSFGWYKTDFSIAGKPVYQPEHLRTASQLLYDFIREVTILHKLNTKSLYLGGFSQGGIISYHLGLRFPEIFRGIVVLGGRLLKETREEIASARSASGLRVFIAHGVLDPVLPIDFAREGRGVVEGLGIDPYYLERPDTGHWVDAGMLQALEKWLGEDEHEK